ncbi:MAG: hypothetical protein KY428_12955, partial [Bacteroidetes bacterium]|nr:hypothetical protein [Bacteroidota bacterium]
MKLTKIYRGWALLMLVLLIGSRVQGQNLETIGQEKPFRYSGGLSLNQIGYGASGDNARRDPYSYFASGNLNLDLYGWSVPVSFSFSNQNLAFQQPFNQYGLHPTYKWVTAHLGWTSMEFSPYTLSGHLFRGAGVELAPAGRFSFQAMWGRLNKAVEAGADSLAVSMQQPAYKRTGFGFKASYAHEGDQADFSLFRSQDDSSSIQYSLLQELQPEENLVMSLSGSKSLFGVLVANAEIASTAISPTQRSPEAGARGIFKLFTPLYTPRSATQYYNAYKAGLNYRGSFYTLGIGYERVDPGYRTHGAYYFNNDLENITLNTTTSLFSGKVNLSLNVGKQRNNLSDEKMSTMNRTVGSLNLSYVASERLNFNGSYSNFQTYTFIRPQFSQINQLTPYDNLDTLNFTQLSQSATLTTSYALQSSKEKRQQLSLNLSLQDAADKQGAGSMQGGTRFYNVNTAYTLSLIPRNTSLNGSFNYSRSQLDSLSTLSLGPTVALSNSFLDKKLRSTLSYSWNDSYSNSSRQGRIMTLRMGGSFTLHKQHNLSLNLVALRRASPAETGQNVFSEFTATLGYSFSFNSK